MGRLLTLAGVGDKDRDGFSLSFNGTDAYVSRNTNNVVNLATPYWVSLWVRGSSGLTDRRIYSEGRNSSATPCFAIGSGQSAPTAQKAYIFMRNDANSILVNAASSSNVFDGVWHNLLWTDNAGTAALYVDGVQDATNFSYTPSSTMTLDRVAIGAFIRTTVTAFYSGLIDEMVSGTGSLTPTQIADIQNHVYPASTINWQLDEGSGVTALDSSGNSNDGVITNATYSGFISG